MHWDMHSGPYIGKYYRGGRLLERRHIRQGTILDPYSSGSGKTVGVHDMQLPIFQMGSTDVQTGGTSQQSYISPRGHKGGRYSRTSN